MMEGLEYDSLLSLDMIKRDLFNIHVQLLGGFSQNWIPGNQSPILVENDVVRDEFHDVLVVCNSLERILARGEKEFLG